MCPSAPRVCSEPGGQKPVLSLSLDLIMHVETSEDIRWVCWHITDTSKPNENDEHILQTTFFELIFLYEHCFILSQILLKFVSGGFIINDPAYIEIMFEQNSCQAIIWTKVFIVYWRICASFGRDRWSIYSNHVHFVHIVLLQRASAWINYKFDCHLYMYIYMIVNSNQYIQKW